MTTAWIVILLAIIANTLIWPVGRWTLAQNGNTQVMGFWMSLTVSVVSGVILFLLKAPLIVPIIWAAGLVFSVAYAVGFCILIMRCLQIGPSGPTATVNNAGGLLVGVLFGILWPIVKTPSLTLIFGLVGTFVALILIGLSKGNKDQKEEKCITPEWIRLVMLGGLFSGISFITQTFIGVKFPGDQQSLALFFTIGFGLSSVILAIYLLKNKLSFGFTRECQGGVVIGIITLVAMGLGIYSMGRFDPSIVWPLTVATPMILTMLIGHFVYREYLGKLAWIGCLLAAISVAVVAYSSGGSDQNKTAPQLSQSMR